MAKPASQLGQGQSYGWISPDGQLYSLNSGREHRDVILGTNASRGGSQAFGEAQAVYEKPTVIIAHTIPGKGVKEFERDYKWHGKPPNKEEATMALKELRTLGGKIKSEHQ